MVLGVESDVARDFGAKPIDVISTKAALGAEVRGVDLKELNEFEFAALKLFVRFQPWREPVIVVNVGRTAFVAAQPSAVAGKRTEVRLRQDVGFRDRATGGAPVFIQDN